jgi:hypothetical protein
MARKPTACQLKRILSNKGIDFQRSDYFDLSSNQQRDVLDAAQSAGYRGNRSGKSRARAYFDYLRRKSCAR